MEQLTDVLVVGAGPAGLACAASLLKNGVRKIILVDAQQSGQNVSRAIIIHAQTIEDLDAIGCSERLITRGIHAQNMIVRAQKKVLIKADFTSLTSYTQFPYALLISQSETESILEERVKTLGGCILRPFKVINIESAINGMKVTFESGETVMARYVVGADGARSMVRKLAGISFKDPSTKRDPHTEVVKATDNVKKDNAKLGIALIIADVYLTGNIPSCISPRGIMTFLGPLGLLLLVPLPADKEDPDSKTIYRMSCPAEIGTKEVTLSRLQNVMDAALGLSKDQTPIIGAILWSSHFRVRSAVADKFFQRLESGVAILVGDAAHVHSPAGGQGMNLGVRDAIQLGRTLAIILDFEVSSQASPEKKCAFADEQLERFSMERRKLALEVIKMTKVMTWATGLRSTTARKARNIIWGLMGRTPLVYNRLVLRLSGLQPVAGAKSDSSEEEKAL